MFRYRSVHYLAPTSFRTSIAANAGSSRIQNRTRMLASNNNHKGRQTALSEKVCSTCLQLSYVYNACGGLDRDPVHLHSNPSGGCSIHRIESRRTTNRHPSSRRLLYHLAASNRAWSTTGCVSIATELASTTASVPKKKRMWSI